MPTMEAIWLLYGGLLLAPFVQEDAAVVAAATLSGMSGANPAVAYCAVLLGLTLSDVWKYWAGRLARTNAWAKKLADKPGVAAARDSVINRLGITLLTARFVPGTRIPLYLASGFFNAPFLKFFAYMFCSAVLYVSLVFALFRFLGAVAGEQIKAYLPLIGVALILGLVITVLVRRLRNKGKATAPGAVVDQI